MVGFHTQVVVSSDGDGHVCMAVCVGTLNWEVFTAKIIYCFLIVEIPADVCVHYALCVCVFVHLCLLL